MYHVFCNNLDDHLIIIIQGKRLGQPSSARRSTSNQATKGMFVLYNSLQFPLSSMLVSKLFTYPILYGYRYNSIYHFSLKNIFVKICDAVYIGRNKKQGGSKKRRSGSLRESLNKDSGRGGWMAGKQFYDQIVYIYDT